MCMGRHSEGAFKRKKKKITKKPMLFSSNDRCSWYKCYYRYQHCYYYISKYTVATAMILGMDEQHSTRKIRIKFRNVGGKALPIEFSKIKKKTPVATTILLLLGLLFQICRPFDHLRWMVDSSPSYKCSQRPWLHLVRFPLIWIFILLLLYCTQSNKWYQLLRGYMRKRSSTSKQ